MSKQLAVIKTDRGILERMLPLGIKFVHIPVVREDECLCDAPALKLLEKYEPHRFCRQIYLQEYTDANNTSYWKRKEEGITHEVS